MILNIAEVDYDRKTNYELGHIPGSVLFDWKKDINEPLNRNILTKQAFEELLQREGVNNDTTLVLYGDFNNWFAAFAFWVFKYYGYNDIRLIVVLPYIGDIIAYQHGLHFCQEVYSYRNQNKV
ncbi:MAG: rhodanese-like domain-containing protein [Candidatus Nitrosopolaris sp.]